MENVNEWTVILVGIVTVFLVFVILYTIFKIMEIVGISRNKKIKMPHSSNQNPEMISTQAPAQSKQINLTDEDEEIVAIFSSIYSLIGENAIIKSVRPLNQNLTNKKETKGTRGWNEWRTYGWRGGNR